VTQTFSRSIFSGIPLEYSIPRTAKVVFVNDFFTRDVEGGAELTTDAIIQKAPVKVFKMHSGSVTRKLLDANKDKYWIFGNFTTLPDGMTHYIPTSGVRYSIVEYDFKFCAYRSTTRHLKETGEPCNCPKEPHGLDIARLFRSAEKIFWMSEGQKNSWIENVPSVADHPCHLVLSSVFKDSDLDLFKHLRETAGERLPEWAVLGSGSWIKGTEETQKWCRLNRKPFNALPKLPYAKFLELLNKHQGFIFMPLDKDTCPRVTIEAKLLGLNLHMNNNVLSKNDPWFVGTPEQCDSYLRTRAEWFWKQVLQPKSE
jgi:hypothetical protein